MSTDLHARVQAFLAAHKSMVFASAADGQQFASSTCYVADDDLNIYGFVFKGSDKFQAIEAGTLLALVIDDGFTVPMHGLEYHGRGEFVSDADAEHAKALLESTFPKLANVWAHPAVVLVRVRPERITLIDWTVRLGHSETLDLADATA